MFFSNSSKKSTYKLIPWSLTAITTVLIYYLLLSKVEVPSLKKELLIQLSPYLALSIVNYLITALLIGPALWIRVLQGMGEKLSLVNAIKIRFGCAPITDISPARLGEIVRGYALSSITGASFFNSCLSIVLEMTANLFSVAYIGCIGYSLYTGKILICLLLLPIFIIEYFLFSKQCITFICRLYRFKNKDITPSAFMKAGEQTALFSVTNKLTIFFISFIYMFMEYITFYIISKGLSLPISFAAVISFLPAVTIISKLPIALNGYGLREGSILYFFSQNGIRDDSLLLTGLLFNAVEFVFPFFIGGFFIHFVWKSVSVKLFKR